MPKIKPWVSPGAQGVFPIPEEYVEIVDVKQELDSELKEPAPEDDSIHHSETEKNRLVETFQRTRAEVQKREPYLKKLHKKKVILLWSMIGSAVLTLVLLYVFNYQIVALANGLSPRKEDIIYQYAFQRKWEQRVVGDHSIGKNTKVGTLKRNGIGLWWLESMSQVLTVDGTSVCMWAEWNYKETVTRDLCLCLIGFNAKSAIEEEKLQQKLPEGVRVRVWQEGSFYNIVYRTDMDSHISYSYLDPLIELGYIDELEYISG